MILLRNFDRRAREGGNCIFCVFAFIIIFLCYPFGTSADNGEQNCKLLKNIHDEVLHFGTNDDPDLIKREFWMDLDGHKDNKEEHVVVMRYSDGLNLKMTVQVTYYSEDKGKRFIRFAKNTKLVQCCIKDHDLKISRSDYNDEEMEKLFSNILIAIRNKKEMLKLIKQQKQNR